MLALLDQEAKDLSRLLVNQIPRRDLGQFFGDFFHREQSLGEIRGLERLQKIINDRKLDLEIQLGLIKNPNPNDNGPTDRYSERLDA